MSEIRILSRNPANWIRETKTELHPINRNLKPDRNPFETVREYQRALNAQKIERVRAKPFVAGSKVTPTACRLLSDIRQNWIKSGVAHKMDKLDRGIWQRKNRRKKFRHMMAGSEAYQFQNQTKV